jgi:hypothetical protein
MAKKLMQFEPKVIKLSAEQKLRFRDAQVRVLGMMQQATQMRDQAAAADQGLIALLTEIAKENHADPLKYTIDLETLNFTLKKTTG